MFISIQSLALAAHQNPLVGQLDCVTMNVHEFLFGSQDEMDDEFETVRRRRR